MIANALVAEFVLLNVLYFQYFGNVLFLSYGFDSSKKTEYRDLAAELERQLPKYTVYYGHIKPPSVVVIGVILALQFYFKGLYNLISKLFAIRVTLFAIAVFVTLFLTLPCWLELNFSISYEGHTLYSNEGPDMEIPNVDKLVDIIKKNENGKTFPRVVAFAGLILAIKTLESTRRRR